MHVYHLTRCCEILVLCWHNFFSFVKESQRRLIKRKRMVRCKKLPRMTYIKSLQEWKMTPKAWKVCKSTFHLCYFKAFPNRCVIVLVLLLSLDDWWIWQRRNHVFTFCYDPSKKSNIYLLFSLKSYKSGVVEIWYYIILSEVTWGHILRSVVFLFAFYVSVLIVSWFSQRSFVLSYLNFECNI